MWLVLYGSSSIQLACVQSVFGDCDLNSARSRVLTRVVDERCVLPSMKLHMVLTTMRGGHRSSPSDVWLVIYGFSAIQLACVPSVFRNCDLSSARPFFMPARERSVPRKPARAEWRRARRRADSLGHPRQLPCSDIHTYDSNKAHMPKTQ